jgi:hypothetical protein
MTGLGGRPHIKLMAEAPYNQAINDTPMTTAIVVRNQRARKTTSKL